MNSEPIIKFRNLSKRFDLNEVLKDITLDITSGGITGLVGSNGSGKSTLLRHIIGLYLPSRGSCGVFNVDAGELSATELARIGYVHQEGQLIGWMNVREIIDYVTAHYQGWNKSLENEYIKRFDIDLNSSVGSLSPGQRQKLAILLAVGFEPELLVLDEPASALDPLARNEFLQLLLDIIRDDKRTIIISSHILSDIEKIIDHVLILHKGRLCRDCGFDELQEEFLKLKLRTLNGSLPDILPLPDVINYERDDNEALLVMKNSRLDLNGLAEDLNCEVREIPLGFEEVYGLVLKEHEVNQERIKLGS